MQRDSQLSITYIYASHRGHGLEVFFRRKDSARLYYGDWKSFFQVSDLPNIPKYLLVFGVFCPVYVERTRNWGRMGAFPVRHIHEGCTKRKDRSGTTMGRDNRWFPFQEFDVITFNGTPLRVISM